MNLAEATEHYFEDPATPTIPRALAWARAKRAHSDLPAEVEWHGTEMPVREGLIFTLDGARLDFPVSLGDGRWWVFFVDLLPRAKWGHPLRWVFVPAAEWLDLTKNRDTVQVRDGTMPPHGDGPSAWVSLGP